MSVFIPIPKRGSTKEYSNYYTVAFISCTSYLILKILQGRHQQYVIHELPDVQAGFGKGRESRGKIANICWISEKARELKKKKKKKTKNKTKQKTKNKNKNIYLCFIDYAKDFDSMDHK